MKLYVCYGTFRSPAPRRPPCGNAYRALKDAGHDPEVMKSYGWGVLPDFLNTGTAQGGQAADRQAVGARCWSPTTTRSISGSKEIVAWAQEHPAIAQLAQHAAGRTFSPRRTLRAARAPSAADLARTTASTSSASRGPSASDTGVAWMRTTDRVGVDLLERDVRVVARRHPHLAVSRCSSSLGFTPSRSRARTSTPAGRAQRHDRGAERGVVRHHERAVAAREDRVDQALAGDRALDRRARACRPACARARRPGTGRDACSMIPAITLPSVLCAASPITTAVTAPPSAIARGFRSTSRSATTMITSKRDQLHEEADGRGRAGIEARASGAAPARGRRRARSASRPRPAAPPR